MGQGHTKLRDGNVARALAGLTGGLCTLLLAAPAGAESPATTQATDVKTSAAQTDSYEPLIGVNFGKWRFEAPILASARFEGTNEFAADRNDTQIGGGGLNTQFRLGLSLDSKDAILPFLLSAEVEADLITGVIVGRDETNGVGLPNSEEVLHAGDVKDTLRKAYLRASLMQYAHLAGGVMTSHWGLGLLANDGAHGWEPGNAQFIDPRGGDRVLRAMLASGPHHKRHKVFAVLAVDSILGDDIVFDGDSGVQFVAALMYGRESKNSAGVYFVRRIQDTEASTVQLAITEELYNRSAGEIDVTVIDATGKLTFDLESVGELTLEGEAAFVYGNTTLAPSVEFPRHKVRQFGATARAKLDRDSHGVILDFLFASGDGDLDDDTQSAFKADRNFSMGLLLYRHLITAQTGLASVTASNPDVVGVPPQDVERFATRGNIQGTLAFFPRAYWRPISGLEVYGGPLIAFGTAPMIDPFNTRINGGDARNALDGDPGTYLGTELDVGARYRTYFGGSELTAGIESGLLLPGSAFNDATGASSDPIFGGRAVLDLRL